MQEGDRAAQVVMREKSILFMWLLFLLDRHSSPLAAVLSCKMYFSCNKSADT
jgi:hypothetical protein